MNKKESFGALVILISFIMLFSFLVGISLLIIISYWSVSIGEIPFGVLIGLIASVWGWLKLLNIGLSIFKEIKDL